MTILEAARSAYAAGLSLLPVAEDGTKRPVVAWAEYQERRPTLEEFHAWRFDTRDGFGVVAGPVSGYRECWDFDTAEVFDAFIAAAEASGLGPVVARIRKGYEDRTPAGGRRWLVTYPETVTWRECVLARRPGRPEAGEPPTKTLIEWKTFSIVAPSSRRTHPSGRAYTRVSGGFDTIGAYTAEERAALEALARSFDAMPRVTETPPRARRPASTDRPGDAFTAETTWPALLEPRGWVPVFARGETVYWRRPGKALGISATTNHAGSDLLYVFSSSTPFEPNRGYSRFGAYAVLEHGGDCSRAALALAKQGYGGGLKDDPVPAPTVPRALVAQGDGTPEPAIVLEPVAAPAAFARPGVTVAVGESVLAPLRDVPFSGWFNRGAVHLVGGSSGAGKTTLVIDLLRRQRRGEAVLGHVGQQLEYLVVFADRGHVSNTETFQRMGIDPATFPVAHIDGVPHAALSAQRIVAAVEAQAELPAAVFVEGADMLVEDPSKPAVVTAFMAALLRAAEHYGLAVILSVGAGKAKPQESYRLKRDQLFGSIMWARRADTVLVLTIDGDGTTPRRHLAVLHRNAPAETFELEYENGRLVPAAHADDAEPDLIAWFKHAEAFTARQFRAAFPRFSGTRAAEVLDGYVALRVLRPKVKNDRTHFVFKSGTPVGLSHENRDDFQDAGTAAEIVPKTSGTGHENDGLIAENPKEFGCSPGDSLIPAKTRPTSHSSLSLGGEWDTNACPTVSPRAREAAELPAWVTADETPLEAGSSDAAFADRDAADVVAEGDTDAA